jgi:predicted PurR-regulated permease PerM
MASRLLASSGTPVATWIVAVLLVVFFLRAAKSLLIPIAVAVLISYALAPVVSWLERRRVPRLAGAALVLVTIVALCGAGGYALKDDGRELARSVPEAIDRVQEMARSQLGSDVSAIQGVIGGAEAGQSQSGDAAADSPVGTAGQTSGSLVQRGAGAIFAIAGNIVVVFFLVFFLLISGHHFRNRLVEVSGPDVERRTKMASIIDDINAQIQRYLLVLLVTACIVGVATWLVLASMGVEHAAVWGILAGVFNSIPYFGPVIVSGGLFVVGLAQGGGAVQAVQMAGAALVITSLEGWLLTPPLMGKAERMSALAVFLGLLLWTWMWGAWGTVLAVPMLVVIKSVADHYATLRPIGRLMAP